MSTDFEKFLAEPKPGKDLQVKALKEIRRSSNNERTVHLAEFLCKMLGTPFPTRPVVFDYDHYNAIGEVTVPERKPLTHRVNEVPRNMTQRTEVAPRGSRLVETTNQIEGDYQLVVQGISIPIARGTDNHASIDPITKEEVVTVRPEVQNFKYRMRSVDPRDEPDHWAFLWMHPRNVDSPARLSRQEQERHGLTISMTSKFLKPNTSNGPKIRAQVRENAQKQAIINDVDTAKLITKIMAQSEATLREWSKQTNINLSRSNSDTPMKDLYISHLTGILNSNSALTTAKTAKEKLKAIMAGGEGFYLEVIQKAMKAGVLICENKEFYLLDSEGRQTQPDSLSRYILVDECLDIPDLWLAGELDIDKKEALISLIDRTADESVMSVTVANGREVSAEAVAAIDQAIATGKIKWVSTKSGKGEWRLVSDKSVITEGRGVSDEQKRKVLMTYAAAVSLGTLLLSIGMVEDE